MSRTTNKNKLQVLRADNEASANDGKHIRNILIFAGIFVLMLGVGMLRAGAEMHSDAAEPTPDPDWSELVASMDKMHMAMGAIERSGNSDIDFVRLMLPHHQGAIDMAKTQLLYGKDPQMRRLAQEIITDQQLEIELMQRWLKQRQPAPAVENQKSVSETGKDK
jgi:Domain of unknown function (DUF305)